MDAGAHAEYPYRKMSFRNTSGVYAAQYPEYMHSRNGYEMFSSWFGAVGVACSVAFFLHLCISYSDAVVYVFRSIPAKPRNAITEFSKTLTQVPALRQIADCISSLHKTFYLNIV
jgi:hypothetical protein